MGIFNTRNSDGASGKGEPHSTIGDKDWRSLSDRRAKSTPPVFSDEAVRQRKHAQAMDKATKQGRN